MSRSGKGCKRKWPKRCKRRKRGKGCKRGRRCKRRRRGPIILGQVL